MYIMTLDTSWTFDMFLEKVIQSEWLEIPTKFSLSLLKELGIEYIIDYDSS